MPWPPDDISTAGVNSDQDRPPRAEFFKVFQHIRTMIQARGNVDGVAALDSRRRVPDSELGRGVAGRRRLARRLGPCAERAASAATGTGGRRAARNDHVERRRELAQRLVPVQPAAPSAAPPSPICSPPSAPATAPATA